MEQRSLLKIAQVKPPPPLPPIKRPIINFKRTETLSTPRHVEEEFRPPIWGLFAPVASPFSWSSPHHISWKWKERVLELSNVKFDACGSLCDIRHESFRTRFSQLPRSCHWRCFEKMRRSAEETRQSMTKYDQARKSDDILLANFLHFRWIELLWNNS